MTILQSYTTQMVLLGTALLGLASGIAGTFAVLRKESLIGDGLSHAALPGVVIAFLLTGIKDIEVLIIGAAVSSITADGQSLPFTIQEVETGDAAVDRFALTYTVEFPAWGTREVAVAYLSSSYGLREGTTYWTQEFTYLLSPARHWAEFGSLDITIRTPEPVPYIVRSSLPLREAEERCYTAHFDSLPDGELTFTLYPRLSITLADRLHAVLTSYQFTFAFFLLILPLTLLALPALLIFLLQRRSRRQP